MANVAVDSIAERNTDNYKDYGVSMFKKIHIPDNYVAKADTAVKYLQDALDTFTRINLRLQDSLSYFKDERNRIVREVAEADRKEFTKYKYFYLTGSILLLIDLLLTGFKEYYDSEVIKFGKVKKTR